MKFQVLMTFGGEVRVAGDSRKDRPVYYGETPETGLWRISVPQFEDYMAGELAQLSFGKSVEEFVFGLEIAELDEWGSWFKATRGMTSYRPKNKQFLSVGQIEWKDIKALPIEAQLIQLGVVLVESIERIGTLQKKPKDFDHAGFADAVRKILSRCTPTFIAETSQI